MRTAKKTSLTDALRRLVETKESLKVKPTDDNATKAAKYLPKMSKDVAIVNKLARIAWAVLSSGKDYRHQSLQPATA